MRSLTQEERNDIVEITIALRDKGKTPEECLAQISRWFMVEKKQNLFHFPNFECMVFSIKIYFNIKDSWKAPDAKKLN